MLELQPITFGEACEFVRLWHRHHLPAQGHKFSIAVNDGVEVVGVVTVGRPVARRLDNGWTLEVTRCCVKEGAPNAASMLYAAAWRAARALGYKRLITYVLASETGTSIKAAGWKVVGQAGGGVGMCQVGRVSIKHRRALRHYGNKLNSTAAHQSPTRVGGRERG